MTVTVPKATKPSTLFDKEPEEKEPAKTGKKAKAAVEGADWIAALFTSQAYKDQKALVRRHRRRG